MLERVVHSVGNYKDTTGFIVVHAFVASVRLRHTAPEFDMGDAYVLFCWLYMRAELDPARAAVSSWIPLTRSA